MSGENVGEHQGLDEAEVAQYDSASGAQPEAGAEPGPEGAELEGMKQRVAEMEAEAAKLREMNETVDREMGGAAGSAPTEEEKIEVDNRSVYVGNVRSVHGCHTC